MSIGGLIRMTKLSIHANPRTCLTLRCCVTQMHAGYNCAHWPEENKIEQRVYLFYFRMNAVFYPVLTKLPPRAI